MRVKPSSENPWMKSDGVEAAKKDRDEEIDSLMDIRRDKEKLVDRWIDRNKCI